MSRPAIPVRPAGGTAVRTFDGRSRLDIWAWVLAGVYFVFFSIISRFKYEQFFYGDQDLAIHAQTMWSLLNADGFCTILGVHFFANHFIPVFYLLRYAYALFDSPLFLLYLQSFALGTGVLLAYRLARRRLEPGWALLVALSYLFHPGIGHANLYEFHQTTLAVPFLFLMIDAFGRRRFVWFTVWALVVMSFQENLPLAVLVMAGIAYWEKREVKWTVLPAVIAVAWFGLSFVLVKPKLNEAQIDFFSIYSHLGSNLTELALSPLTKTSVWISTLLSKDTWIYFFRVFGPMVFIPVLGWKDLLPALPFILQHTMSLRWAERSYLYHYYVELLPYLVLATTTGVSAILAKARGHREEGLVRKALAFAFIVSFVASSILASPLTTSLDTYEKFNTSEFVRARLALLAQVPKDAPTVASLRFLPRLAHRKELYSFHNVYIGVGTLSTKAYAVPEGVTHALIDLKDQITFSMQSRDNDQRLRDFLVKDRSWRVADSAGDMVLFEKADRTDFSKLFEVNPGSPKAPDIALKAIANDEMELEGVSLGIGDQGHHMSQLLLTFHWKLHKKTERRIQSAITLVDPRGRTVYEDWRDIGYRLRPTYEWAEGDRMVERYWLILPSDLPKEPLELRVGIGDPEKVEFLRFKSKIEGRIDPNGRAKVDTFDPTY
ncbi:MAG: hypothetical protein MOGMAGMI_01688 [Candidatus Omnitrophica bacterium]|nr:hypothetical protein [Candidatus Omnitrophota bacterium]